MGKTKEHHEPIISILQRSYNKPDTGKELRDGQLFILREGKMYNVQGKEVR